MSIYICNKWRDGGNGFCWVSPSLLIQASKSNTSPNKNKPFLFRGQLFWVDLQGNRKYTHPFLRCCFSTSPFAVSELPTPPLRQHLFGRTEGQWVLVASSELPPHRAQEPLSFKVRSEAQCSEDGSFYYFKARAEGFGSRFRDVGMSQKVNHGCPF